MANQSFWSNANTLIETGIEIYKLMEQTGKSKSFSYDTSVEKITDGVLLISDDKEFLLVINKESKLAKALSDLVISYGEDKAGYLVYPGERSAIPLFELSKIDESIRDYIISEESLRATLCGNYPEYVKTYNAIAPPGVDIRDADAPPSLYLQKQLDLASDEVRFQVAEFQDVYEANNHVFEDVMELER